MSTTIETIGLDRAVAMQRQTEPTDLGFLTIGPDTLKDYSASSVREWLATNGIGGYASGSLSGTNTRRYHGLLVAATTPPTGRTVLLSKVEETVTLDGATYELGSNQYPGTIHPRGFKLLERFRPWPATEFRYRIRKDVLLEKRIWMEYGRNTTYVQYSLDESSASVGLRLSPLTCCKDYHAESRASAGFPYSSSFLERDACLRVRGNSDSPELTVQVVGAGWERADYWFYNVEHAREMERGLDWREDLYCPGHFLLGMTPGQSITLVATVENEIDPPDVSWRRLLARQEDLVRTADVNDEHLRALVLAADAFVIERGHDVSPSPSTRTNTSTRKTAVAQTDTHDPPLTTHHQPTRSTIIAGYHWFSDWGRDTMISLPGLCLSTGRRTVAREILLSFATFVSEGMLPNRFPDRGEEPEYNTVDATLWYFQAIQSYLDATGDPDLARELWPVLKGIIDWHVRGTRYGIGVDKSDGLLEAGVPGVQLTWMDARVGDWVVTPRIGKPVEINALWYNALRIVDTIAQRLDKDSAKYSRLAKNAEAGFMDKFVRQDGLGLYDVVSKSGPDTSIRPNQIFAVSLPHSPIPKDVQKQVVDVVAERLLTPAGLRSLAPDDPAYKPIYQGGPAERDGSYHQGTVWPWLLGPFVEAHLRVYNDATAAKNLVSPMLQRMALQGIGQLSEIADGDLPHSPNGCIAQAWSVAETLRICKLLAEMAA